MTKVLYPNQILQAAAIIKSGGLVAFPTETVYGLGADGFNAVAVQKIFRAKNRPSSDPIILHLERLGDFAKVANLHGREALLERLSPLIPGALTLVLPKLVHIPLEVTAGGGSVAARVPAHPLAQALIAAVGTPIAAPSANLFSRPSPTSAQMVLEDLDGRIDAVLDGGSTNIGLESTVLSLLDAPTLLRPGGVLFEDIEALIGEVLLPSEAVLDEAHAQPAPGMLLKHYSPKAQMLLLESPDLLLKVARHYQRERLGLLLPTKSLERLQPTSAEVFDLDSTEVFDLDNAEVFDLDNAEVFDLGADEKSIAMRLFAGLRGLDAAGCTHILAHKFPNTGLGRALNDRLFRAASGRVIG